MVLGFFPYPYLESIAINADTIDLFRSVPFVGVHVVCRIAVWTGVSTTALAIGFLTLTIQMFGLTDGA